MIKAYPLSHADSAQNHWGLSLELHPRSCVMHSSVLYYSTSESSRRMQNGRSWRPERSERGKAAV